MPKATYKIGPIEVVDRNITRARESAERQAAEALNRLAKGGCAFSGPPVRSGILAIEIRPGLYDWGYSWVEEDHFSFRTICGGFETYQACLWAAVRHAAQNSLGVREECPQVFLDKIEDWAAKVLQDPSQATVLRAELRDMEAWQERYRKWKEVGFNDIEAHHSATLGRLPNQGDQHDKETP